MIAPMLLALAAQTATSAYALIVTNNRSLALERPDLRYADDDGAQYAALYGQFFGDDQVHLLTTFDRESALLHPKWAARAEAPTVAALERAVDRLSERVAADQRAGREVDLHLVLAGHGDLEAGQGYIELSDGRLSADALDARVIARLPADRIHLVLDSCNSYFMLNPRKPGGRRWQVHVEETKGLLERHPNVSAILSTSAEAVTYEWSELQSGVFSYELRSGLRGAADANGDSKVTYEELEAFIATANESITNDLYRPKVLAFHPPQQTMLTLSPRAPRTLHLPAESRRRFTFRDDNGVRVLDVHKEAGTAMTISLPPEAGPLTLHETVSGADRPEVVVRRVPVATSLRLADLGVVAPSIARRGEAPIFSRLFATPFGQRALDAHSKQRSEAPEPFYGVTRKDAERMGLFLSTTAALERDARRMGGVISLGGATALGLLGAAVLNDNTADRGVGYISIGGAAAFFGIGIGALLIPSESETLDEEYRARDFSTERSRAEAVVETEARLADIADDWAMTRVFGGSTMLGMGVLALGFPILDAATGIVDMPSGPALTIAGVGASLTALGSYLLFGYRYPVERTFELQQRALGSGRPIVDPSAALDRAARPADSVRSATAFGLSGRF